MDKINDIEKAVEILKAGGIIAYPTETVYGLGANIFNEQSIIRVFETKSRALTNPISIAISSFEMLERVAYLSREQRKIAKKLLPGPVTIILPKKELVSPLITAGSELLGIRFPEHKTAIKIIKKTRFPITSTSANLSGEKEATTYNEVNIKVDFIVSGKCKYKKPSTILDLTNMRILREGAGIEKVRNILGINK